MVLSVLFYIPQTRIKLYSFLPNRSMKENDFKKRYQLKNEYWKCMPIPVEPKSVEAKCAVDGTRS